MKFAVWILVLAAALSLLALMAGELLPKSANESLLFKLLGMGDPFRSWWFRLMLGILSLSLLVCIIERAPILIRLAFLRTFRDDTGLLGSMPLYTKLTIADGEASATRFFRKLGFSVERKDGDGKVLISGVSGGLSRLGPVLSHLGMLLLIIGGLAVSLTTYKMQVVGIPGQTVEQPEWGFRLKIDDFRIIYYPVGLNLWVETSNGRRGKVELMKGDSAKVVFGVPPNARYVWMKKSDLKTDFEVSGDGGTMPYQGNIKSYMSTVTVLEGDRELYQKKVEVNSPLRERGYRFYQSSFQKLGSLVTVDSVVLHCEGDGGHSELTIKVGDALVVLPWGEYSLAVPQFFNDFKLDEQFKPFSASNELNNPAARVELYQEGTLVGASWVFARADAHMGANLPVNFNLVDVKSAPGAQAQYATVLEVTKEGGRPIVWAGFFVMTIGLMLTYMLSQRQAWGIIVKRGDGKDDVYLAAVSPRDPEHFRGIWEERISGIQQK
jgi:cytochrome c biogenesis protein